MENGEMIARKARKWDNELVEEMKKMKKMWS